MLHALKLLPQYFEQVSLGNKTFEIRHNDRDYKVGDLLLLQEWNPNVKDYTGKEITKIITYMTDYGQPEGQVALAIQSYCENKTG